MFYLIMVFSCVILLFLGMGIASYIEGDTEKCIVYFIVMILTIGLSICVIMSVKNNTPEKQNVILLQNIETANKEYEKFLIDYPEFKEE